MRLLFAPPVPRAPPVPLLPPVLGAPAAPLAPPVLDVPEAPPVAPESIVAAVVFSGLDEPPQATGTVNDAMIKLTHNLPVMAGNPYFPPPFFRTSGTRSSLRQ